MTLRWTLTYSRLVGSTQITLSKDPRGWQDLILTHERSEQYHGIFFEYSQELGFFCQGAGKELIDEAYVNEGSEAIVFLLMESRCGETPNFEIIYDGKLDMASYRQEYINKTLYTFTNIVQKGITSLITNRDQVEIDITSTQSLDGQTLANYDRAPYTMYMHNKIITFVSLLQTDEDFLSEHEVTIGAILGVGFSMRFNLGFILKLDDFTNTFRPGPQALVGGSLSDVNPFLKSQFIDSQDVMIEYHIKGTFQDKWRSGDHSTIRGKVDRMRLAITRNTTILHISNTMGVPDYFPLGPVDSDVFPIDVAGSFQLNNLLLDQEVRVYIFIGYEVDIFNLPNVTFCFNIEKESFIKATVQSTFGPTEADGVAIHEAWSRVSEGIGVTAQTPDLTKFMSEFFGRTDSQGLAYDNNGCGAFTSITNGLNIRAKQSPIKCTLQDMFNSCNAIWNIGLGLDTHEDVEVIRVEEKEHFYPDDLIFTAANIKNLKMEFDENLAPTEVQIGYERWETEEINGIDEPNTRATWTLRDMKNHKNKVDFLSPYITSMYAIEFTRRYNIEKASTADWRYDNENFIIALNQTTDSSGQATRLDVPEINENFITITNLISPETSYNLRFNLASNLRRLLNIITTALPKLEPSNLIATLDEGNPDVTYVDNTAAVAGHVCVGDYTIQEYSNVEDVTYKDANARREDPIWQPEIWTFDYPVSFGEYATIRANPKGLVRFSEDGQNFKQGWIRPGGAFKYNLRQKIGTFELVRKFDG